MAVETSAERILLLQDFGVSATWSGGTVVGIFDTYYSDDDGGGGTPFAMSQPRFFCQSSDIVGLSNGDELAVVGVDYYVRVTMPDGNGMTELALELK